MIAQQPAQRMTVDEYMEFVMLPENQETHFELVDGEIFTTAPVRKLNSITGMRTGYFVNAHVIANDLGYVTGADGGYRIAARTVRQPDVGFISKARAGGLAGVAFDGAPDLAVEVVSPDEDVLGKARGYLMAGGRLVWALYPQEQVVLVITRKPDGGYDVRELGAADRLDGGDVLPGFSVAVSALFPLE